MNTLHSSILTFGTLQGLHVERVKHVEFYSINNQDIDDQCESNFPCSFAPFFILEEIPFTCEHQKTYAP